jgi:hypothetical protein
MKNNREVFEEVHSSLGKLDTYRDMLEVLANIFIVEGMQVISKTSDVEIPASISPEAVVDIVLDERKKNGETIGTAMCMQGLTIFSWLEGESNE